LVILIASFVAATGLIWLGEEIADGCAAHSIEVFRTISCRQQLALAKILQSFQCLAGDQLSHFALRQAPIH
jgi:hypothetical protein